MGSAARDAARRRILRISDESIAARIERLVTEEKDLRQRRALREFDLDPEGTEVRDPDVVERYEQ